MSVQAPTRNRAFLDLLARLETDDPTLTVLDFSVGAWWLTGEDVQELSLLLGKNTVVQEVGTDNKSII